MNATATAATTSEWRAALRSIRHATPATHDRTAAAMTMVFSYATDPRSPRHRRAVDMLADLGMWICLGEPDSAAPLHQATSAPDAPAAGRHANDDQPRYQAAR